MKLMLTFNAKKLNKNLVRNTTNPPLLPQNSNYHAMQK